MLKIAHAAATLISDEKKLVVNALFGVPGSESEQETNVYSSLGKIKDAA